LRTKCLREAASYWHLFLHTLPKYICFKYSLYYLYHHNKEEKVRKKKHDRVGKQFLVIALGVAAVYLGAHFSVESSVNLARIVGLSEWFIGATVLAVGTSLPEISVAFQALRRRKPLMSVGTAIGSNVFNVFVILGLASFATPLLIPLAAIWFDLLVLLASAVIVTAFMASEHKVDRREGYALLAVYLFYLLYLFAFRV